jgi:outer membrane protein assembly factor BamB
MVSDMEILALHLVLMTSSCLFVLLVQRFVIELPERRKRDKQRLSTLYLAASHREPVTQALGWSSLSTRGMATDAWQRRTFAGRKQLARQLWRAPGLCWAFFATLGWGATVSALAHEPIATWSSFQNGGRTQADLPLPTAWSPTSPLWSQELKGYGQSSPVVFGDTVFVTSTSGKQKELLHLLALELASGKLLWEREFNNPSPEENSSYISRAAPTPVVDSQSVYLLYEGGMLASVDHLGQPRWQRDLVADFGPISASDGRGESNSAEKVNSNGLVRIELQQDGSYRAAFAWRADKATCNFGSPLIAAGKVWIVNRTGALYALDLETGEQIHLSRVKSGSIWATPLADRDHLFRFGQKGTTSVLSLETGEELATNQLWEAPTEAVGEPSMTGNVQYAAATSAGYLLIRRGDKLFAIR